MAINILTTDDLQKFKEELFVELRQTLGKQTKQDKLGKFKFNTE